MRQLIKGLLDFYKAYQIINRGRMWKYVFIPAAATAVVTPFIVYLFWVYFDRFSDYVNENWLPEMLRSEAAAITLDVLMWMLGLLLFFVSFRNIIMAIFSPLLGMLSEKTEYHATGQPAPPFSLAQMTKDILRALALNALALAITVLLLATAWLLVFLPLVGAVLSPALILLIESFFAGLSFADPTLERHRFNVRESFAFSYQHKGRMIGNGLGFTALMLIPIAGWFLAPPLSVVAATLSALDILEKEPRSA